MFEGGDFNTFRYEVELLKWVFLVRKISTTANHFRGFQHPRVGRMYGVVTQAFPYQLILELPMNGDLKTFLTKVSKGDDKNQWELNYQKYTQTSNFHRIGPRDLVQIAFDVACGLEYLHSVDHVHRYGIVFAQVYL